MNTYTERQLLDELRNSRFFTLHVDESTDITANKCLLVYARFLIAEKKENVSFLKALDLEACDATSITDSIIDYFTNSKIDGGRMVMFTSDGASVMLGCHNGVAKQLSDRLDIQELIVFHCIAHREALAMKDSYADSPYFKRIDTSLREIINYLSTHKHSKGVKKLAKLLGLDSVKIQKLIEVRWLARSGAVHSLVRDLPVLQNYFAKMSDNEDTAIDLYARITDPEFLLAIHHLDDILQQLQLLNLSLQREDLHPFEVPVLADATIRTLKLRYIDGFESGPSPRKCVKLVEDDELKVKTGTSLKSDDNQLVRACDILDPNRYDEEDGTYGRTEIMLIHHAFGSIDDVDNNEDIDAAIENQWICLKMSALGSAPHTAKNWGDLLQIMIVDPRFNLLAPIAEAVLCFDASNAEVERGISLYNRLKTKQRNRLTVSKVDILMRLRLCAASYETFDYDAAYKIWVSEGKPGRYTITIPRASAEGEEPQPDIEVVFLLADRKGGEGVEENENAFDGLEWNRMK